MSLMMINERILPILSYRSIDYLCPSFPAMVITYATVGRKLWSVDLCQFTLASLGLVAVVESASAQQPLLY
jgi:hypothetical protein